MTMLSYSYDNVIIFKRTCSHIILDAAICSLRCAALSLEVLYYTYLIPLRRRRSLGSIKKHLSGA